MHLLVLQGKGIWVILFYVLTMSEGSCPGPAELQTAQSIPWLWDTEHTLHVKPLLGFLGRARGCLERQMLS